MTFTLQGQTDTSQINYSTEKEDAHHITTIKIFRAVTLEAYVTLLTSTVLNKLPAEVLIKLLQWKLSTFFINTLYLLNCDPLQQFPLYQERELYIVAVLCGFYPNVHLSIPSYEKDLKKTPQ